YGNLTIPNGVSLAVVGSDDGIIRAGFGVYENDIGKIFGLVDEGNQNVQSISSRLQLGQWPLATVASLDMRADLSRLAAKQRHYELLAISATMAIIAGMLVAFNMKRRFDGRLLSMAMTDSLTGLPNRVAFVNHLNCLCGAQSDGGEVALLLVDLDGFKSVNDTHGHPVGDIVLVEAARRIRAAVTRDDFVARLGGDEFVVVQPILRFGEATRLAARLCADLSAPMQVGLANLAMGGTVGVACFPSDAQSPEDLLARSDLALYDAKNTARGTHSHFKPAMDKKIKLRRDILDGVERALERGEFELYYQPIIDLSDMAVTKFEALIRWNHPSRGLIPPLEFIPILEETGAIIDVGAWVIETACAHLASCPENIVISVNCSPKQFQADTLSTIVMRALKNHALDPKRLMIEITESLMLDENVATLRNFVELHKIGVILSIDDFGTGFSALRYLTRYRVHNIKIDRSFISDPSGERKSDASVVRAIVALARSMDMTVIAEGVETKKQLEFVRDVGCDFVQGYLFGKPAPALTSLVKSNAILRGEREPDASNLRA
ncbi:MAG: bifunctional diguanylate cyclase/phosphodiesterase, partial [Hyphomicrobiales bacterium]|nr:bifunctional diguanylate cyclase/phosphodiesterase [Hyphomicrobiales bacterium]